MNGKEKIMLDRVVFILIAVVLIASVLVLYGILGVDASFVAGIGALETVQSEIPDDIMTAIDEPDDAYQLAKLTFGGTCTLPLCLAVIRSVLSIMHTLTVERNIFWTVFPILSLRMILH